MATITNFITNPSMETNVTGWTAYGTTTLTRTTDTAASGDASMVVATSSSNQGVSHTGTPATVGQSWVLSAAMVGTGARVRMSVVERGSGGELLLWNAAGIKTLTDDWERYAYIITLSQATTASIEVRLLSDHTDGTPFGIDAVMLHEGTEPIDYFDGDSDNAEWTGTPHNSTSVLTIPDTPRIFPVLKPGPRPITILTPH